jgi:hypothetical protein
MLLNNSLTNNKIQDRCSMNFKGKESLDDLVRSAYETNTEGTPTSVVNIKATGEENTDQTTPVVKQPEQPTKQASLEVLLSVIAVHAKNGATVYPARCPGKGRVQDYGQDAKGKPACVFHGTNCPYFGDAMFNIDDYFKQITCMVDERKK